jgi:hypothetical protein
MLGFISNELNSIGVPYEFMRWTGAVSYPYVVGEYSEITATNEDGFKESTMILTGFTRGSWLELEQIKEKIQQHFPTAGGLRGNTEYGSVAIFYNGSYPIDTGEAELKKIQINLDVKEWRN